MKQVLAVAKPIVRWGVMPVVLFMGMMSEPKPALMDVLYPL